MSRKTHIFFIRPCGSMLIDESEDFPCSVRMEYSDEEGDHWATVSYASPDSIPIMEPDKSKGVRMWFQYGSQLTREIGAIKHVETD